MALEMPMNAWLRHIPSATWPGVEDPWLALAEPLARSMRHEPSDRRARASHADRSKGRPAVVPRWIELAMPGDSVVLWRVPVAEVHRVDRRLRAAD